MYDGKPLAPENVDLQEVVDSAYNYQKPVTEF